MNQHITWPTFHATSQDVHLGVHVLRREIDLLLPLVDCSGQPETGMLQEMTSESKSCKPRRFVPCADPRTSLKSRLIYENDIFRISITPLRTFKRPMISLRSVYCWMVWRMSVVKCMLPLHRYLHMVLHRYIYIYTIVVYINPCVGNIAMHCYFKLAV